MQKSGDRSIHNGSHALPCINALDRKSLSTVLPHSNTVVLHSNTVVLHSNTALFHYNTVVLHSNTVFPHYNTVVLHSNTAFPHSNTVVFHSIPVVLDQNVTCCVQVSMFCESEPTTIRSMMEILQGHGELVVCCGSSLNMHNMPVFEAADMAGKEILVCLRMCMFVYMYVCELCMYV